MICGQETRREINTAREINRTVEEDESGVERCPPESLEESSEHKLSGKHCVRGGQDGREMEAESWRIVKDKEGRLLRIDKCWGKGTKEERNETRTGGPAFNTSCYLQRLT